MTFRLVVAGVRYFDDYVLLSKEIDEYRARYNNSLIIVSGCADGADRLGEKYAVEHSLSVERYPAEWDKYGKAAGPLRNKQMAEVADAVIVFWDGESKGTKSMIDCAKQANIPCKIIEIERKESQMELIDNKSKLLGDDLQKEITHGTKLKMVASYFSIYAFEALKEELSSIEDLEFIFPSPTFVNKGIKDNIKKEKREYYIPQRMMEHSLYGTEFEIRLRNQLTQRLLRGSAPSG